MKAPLLAALVLTAPTLARAQDQWTAPPRPPAYAPPPPDYGPPPAGAPPGSEAPPPAAAEPPPVYPGAPLPPAGPPPAALPDGAHIAEAGELCYPAPPPGQTHDGFYLRLQIGPSFVSAHQGDTSYLGAGVGLGFGVGVVVFPNLALFGTFFFHSADEPSIKANGVSMSISGSSIDVDSFGAGLVYYVMPLNVFASAAIAGSQATLYDKDQNRLTGSNTGVGFQVTAGKEWWVGREWGLGAAAELTGAWMTDTDDSTVRWNAFTYSLLFSATYN